MKLNRAPSVGQPATYRLQVQGRLDATWSDWFGGMNVTVKDKDDGPAITTMTGVIPDQAALYGLLNRLRDLGLLLLEVRHLG